MTSRPDLIKQGRIGMRMRLFLAFVVLPFLHCAVPGGTRPCVQDPDDGIRILPGDVSLILAVPHDGGERLCGVPDRRNSHDVSFRVDRDAGTVELSRLLREEIQKRTGKTPAVVQSRLTRLTLDPNRSSREGTDNPGALRAWESYHARIGEALTRSGPRVLIEIHSQASFPADILSRPPHESLRVILKRMDALGYGVMGVSSHVDVHSMEHSCFIGPCRVALREPVPDAYLDGYTARTHRAEGVRSMQLEIHARRLRNGEARRSTAADLARAIVEAGLLKD